MGIPPEGAYVEHWRDYSDCYCNHCGYYRRTDDPQRAEQWAQEHRCSWRSHLVGRWHCLWWWLRGQVDW